MPMPRSLKPKRFATCLTSRSLGQQKGRKPTPRPHVMSRNAGLVLDGDGAAALALARVLARAAVVAALASALRLALVLALALVLGRGAAALALAGVLARATGVAG